jgi:hypothetical protein
MRGGNRSEWKNNIVPKWVCEMVAAWGMFCKDERRRTFTNVQRN